MLKIFKSCNTKNKKVFVSVPFHGFDKDHILNNIETMHAIAESVFGQRLIAVHNYKQYRRRKNTKMRLFFMSMALKKMSSTDYFIGIQGNTYKNNGCRIEREIASAYYDTAEIFLINDAQLQHNAYTQSWTDQEKYSQEQN
jgi:hypothetical protein